MSAYHVTTAPVPIRIIPLTATQRPEPALTATDAAVEANLCKHGSDIPTPNRLATEFLTCFSVVHITAGAKQPGACPAI